MTPNQSEVVAASRSNLRDTFPTHSGPPVQCEVVPTTLRVRPDAEKAKTTHESLRGRLPMLAHI